MSGTAPTQAAAKRLGARLVVDNGGSPPMTGLTVAELIDLHLEENGYKPTTHADFTRIRDRLPDAFKNREITTVTPVIIDALYRQLSRDGWTPLRVRRAHELLGPSFVRAKRRGWVTTVPTRDAELPRAEEREDTTPDIEDVRIILANADQDFRTFLWLAATTGARRGELCALEWDDLDLRHMQLRIRRSASYTPASGLKIGDVKTGSKGRRSIDVDELTIAELERHHLTQRTAALEAGTVCKYLFSKDFVTCWRPDFATYRFVELRDRLELHHVRLHDLRHFVATELVGMTDARTAAGHMGHARTSMTLDRYAADRNDRRKTAADTLQQRLRG